MWWATVGSRPASVRGELEEAVGVMGVLRKARELTRHGRYFDIDRARLWDRSESPPTIGIFAGPPPVPSQSRWVAGDRRGNAELPHPVPFAAATEWATPDDVPECVPCGPNAVRPYAEPGFD